MSTDSRFSHKIWSESELSRMVTGGIPFPMLSDPGGKIGQVNGVYDEGGGVGIRGRFIIDSDDIVQAMEVLTPPSGWQPGDKTLKPRPDLAGNVWKEWRPEGGIPLN